MLKYSISHSALSNLSLDSIEEDEIEPWHGLIQKLSVFHLDSLHAVFKEGKYKNEQSIRKPDEGLSKEEFVGAIEEVFGNCKYSLQAMILYRQIDKEENKKITWDQFLDFIIENSNIACKLPLELNIGNIFSPPHVERDTISKIVLIETEKYFCYAILSKFGHVGLYDGHMNFLTSYRMIMTREDITRKEEERRRRNRWVTDAIFLQDVLMLVIATSTRSITIYDASGLTHTALWLVLGIPNIIECLSYHFDINNKTNILFMGDNNGQLLSMKFLQPKNGLLRKKHSDKLSFFYWIQLPNEKEFVLIKIIGQLHNGSLLGVQFCPDNNVTVTCSRDANASVIIKPLENRRNSYIFKMHQGASSFAISRFLKVLITGSDDGTVRIWNIVVTSKPLAILKDHQNGIIDIQIMELQELFLSCSRDGVLKLWTVKEQKCLQSLNIKFPSFKILGKTIEWGMNSIYPGPKEDATELNKNEQNISRNDIWQRSHLFVVCCNYMAQINLNCTSDSSKSLDVTVLPPPPLQNSVLIPTNWRICKDDTDSTSDDTSREETDLETLAKHIDSLKFILEKDILSEHNLHNDINFRLACLERKKLKMEAVVTKCAPYLALDLQDIEEIRLSPNLPIPTSKRIKCLVDKTHHILSDAAARTQIFLEQSPSSRSQSSRSSIITFE